MNYGFTGTREGMSERQILALEEILCDGNTFTAQFHHGGCHGADMDAHKAAAIYTCRHVHPGSVEQHWHWENRNDYGTLLPWKPFLERNYDIVDVCEALIAAPRTLYEERRSGTWATIRYARKIGRPVIILDP